MNIEPFTAANIVVEHKEIGNYLYLTAELKGGVSVQINLDKFASPLERERTIKDIELDLRKVFVERLFGRVRVDAKNALACIDSGDHSCSPQLEDHTRKLKEAIEQLLESGSDLV